MINTFDKFVLWSDGGEKKRQESKKPMKQQEGVHLRNEEAVAKTTLSATAHRRQRTYSTT